MLSRKRIQQLLDTFCNEPVRATFTAAQEQCEAQRFPQLVAEHLLLALLDSVPDALALCRTAGVKVDALRAALNSHLPRPAARAATPALDDGVVHWLLEGWLVASMDDSAASLGTHHLLLALRQREVLEHFATEVRPLLAPLKSGQVESAISTTRETGAAGTDRSAPGTGPSLQRYTVDLTARATAGHLDPVLHREEEIDQVIHILCQRDHNNPILTGEAGVGKTAVVEGLAQRIHAGTVPPALRGAAIHALDLALLQAGAGVKGEFEQRLKTLIAEVQDQQGRVILFIDEAHTLVGAGGTPGQSDAANLLKPALARGELRTIAATTWDEYKKFFEKDQALDRRFQRVAVEELTPAATLTIVRSRVPALEKHHGVRVLDEAVRETVRLAERYVPDRSFPDKAVRLLDRTCAAVAASQQGLPPAVERLRQELQDVDAHLSQLSWQAELGADMIERQRLEQVRADADRRFTEARARVEHEQDLVRAFVAAAATGQPALAWAELRQKLESFRGDDEPLVYPWVDSWAVAATVARWTGIPAGRLREGQRQVLRGLEKRLGDQVIGQALALRTICQVLQTARLGLTDERRPAGAFLLAGPPGVGKTETARALAAELFGGPRHLHRFDMAEYHEEHKVALLIGAPPGYVGYGGGGKLTEAVRRRPYSVVLLELIEHADPSVLQLFTGALADGVLTDSEGRPCDFRHTVFVLTTNKGGSLLSEAVTQDVTETLRPELAKTFGDAFVRLLTLVPYFGLSQEVLGKVVDMQMKRFADVLRRQHGVALEYRSEAVKHLKNQVVVGGFRHLEQVWQRDVYPVLGEFLLDRGDVGPSHCALTLDASEHLRVESL